MAKRLEVAIIAAFAIGFLFDYFRSGGFQIDTATNLLRFATAFFVSIAGVITLHPLFGFRMFLLRGAAIGALLAVVAQGTADLSSVLATGAALGLLVDYTATKVAGEGKKLLHSNNI